MGNVAVYKRGTTDFYNQGLGVLSDVLTSELTQVVASSGSVSQQLVMEYPLDGYLSTELVEGALVRVSVSKDKGDFGVFEISDTLKDDSGTLTIYADAYYNRILRMSFDNGGVFKTFPSVQLALDEARSAITGFPAGFALTSNLGKAVDLSAKTYETFGDFLEALVSASGGNAKYTLNGIQIYSALGKDITNIILRDDMNTTSVKVKTDYSGIINKVIPVLPGKDDSGNNTQDTVVGQVVTSKYGQQFLDYWAGKVIAFDTQDLANSYFDRTHADRPVQTVEVSPLDMDEDFSSINIFDRITLYSTKLDYKNKLRVSERVFDTLSEEVKSFKLGSSTANVFNQINEQNETLFNNVKNVTNALISANGKGLDYFGQAQPENPKEGDLWFWDDGTDSGIKQFVDGEWVSLVELATAKKVADSVAKALLDATNYSDKLVADNAEQVNAALDDVQAKQADLTAQQAELDTKAQGYANKALADAKANTLATATQTAKDASDALEKAKTDLTTSLNKEVTDRANAVTALDTKAKGYADTAKADAIATANGAVAKEVTNRQKAITDLDAKSTGAINQARTDAQSALDALQVGGCNLYTDTKNFDNLASWWGSSSWTKTTDTYNGLVVIQTTQDWNGLGQYIPVKKGDVLTYSVYAKYTSGTGTSLIYWPFNNQADGTNYNLATSNLTEHPVSITDSWQRVSSTVTATSDGYLRPLLLRTHVNTNTLQIAGIKVEKGNKATDYTQAPEDIVLDYTTKDNVISQSLTQYQTTNDGNVSKAQSDATQALSLVATKVSQTDYNTKTGDLDSKYTAVKQTADQASTDIVAIKSDNNSQDTKINTLTSDVSGTKQSISDIQTEQGKQSTKINTIQTDVSGTKQDISDIKDANGVQDGKIVSISTTVDGLSSSFSTYKTTNDGKVAKAQADITANATAISQKVSQTAYDAKTGQLQTDLNTTTATANTSKQDILAIKSDNTKQDARMTTIESDANGTKTTVSNLQTDLGKTNGSITTLQQRADGFDATVATLGGVNQVINSEFTPDFSGWLKDLDFTNNRDMWDVTGLSIDQYTYKQSNIIKVDTTKYNFNPIISMPVKITDQVGQISFSAYISTVTGYTGRVSARIKFYDANRVCISTSSGPTVTSNTGMTYVSETVNPPVGATYVAFAIGFDAKDGFVRMSKPMMSFSSRVMDYVQGNYNNNASVAKAQLTADNASLALSNYQTDADGRISKAQADIIVNANAITQKVSQSDYNAKTGDLITKVNTAQSTADSATSTIGAYKTSNDARVASAESKITANATAITQKVSQTDYDQKTGELSGKISEVSQTAGKISQSVSDVKAQVDGLSVGGGTNLLIGTSRNEVSGKSYWIGNYKISGGLQPGTTYTLSGWARVDQTAMNNQQHVFACAYTSDWSWTGWLSIDSSLTAKYNKITFTTPSGKQFSPTVDFYLSHPNGDGSKDSISGTGYISKLKLEKGIVATDWSPAPEDVDNKISTVSQTVDGISSIVSDPATGLTKRVQTAEGSISTVQSNVSDLQSKQTQTANGLTTEISNRQTGDTNTLTQAKDFTTSSISNSESGMRSQITQTSDAIIAQIGNTNLVFNSEFDPDNDGWYKVPAVGQPVSAPIKTTITTAYSDWEEAHGSRGISFKTTDTNMLTSKPVRVASNSTYSISMLAGRPESSTVTETTDFRLGLWDNNKNYIGAIATSNPLDGTEYVPLTYYKTENIAIPEGTYYVSFVLAKSSWTASDVIYQPMLNYGPTAMVYSPTYATNSSGSILTLLKDNWSIGIADNAGAITSGIVGNASNMSLISNNVTINSPQTQIKGTAWINSAMIGNGQIGNAQIGDASISSAKIMNLDVNKITGNVSNWVLSQWTSATGSKVTIDGNGLYFSPGTSRMTANGFEAWRMDGGSYKAMGMLGSYAWETNSNINGVGLIAKFSGVPHSDPNDPYRNEAWGGDTIAIGALEPEIGRGYDYVTPYMIFPSNNYVGNMYFAGNNNDTIIMSRWLSIYTGLNMRGHSIVNSSGYSLKENFSPLSGADALDIFDNTEIMTYDYKPDSDALDERTLATMKNKVGFVINDNGESPFKTDPRLVRYGNTRDDSVTVGYLMSAVKELHAKVKELETKLEAQK